MTHLVKMLARNTSSPWLVSFNERYRVTRVLTTSEYEPEILSDISSGGKYSEEQAKPLKKGRKKGFQPIILKENLLRKIRSVAGISVMSFSVGWAKIDLQEMRLVTCMCENIEKEKTDNMETFTYKKAKSISNLLPESDLYIMERVSQNRKSEDFYFKIMMTSMLAALLCNPMAGPLGEENVLFQNPQVIDHIYKLMVDKERISGGQALRRLLDSSVAEQFHTGQSDITISIKDTTFTAKREIVKSMFFSKPTTNHSNAIALFIALSFISCNPTVMKLDHQNNE